MAKYQQRRLGLSAGAGLIALIGLVTMILAFQHAAAIPPQQAALQGAVTIGGNAAPDGTNITLSIGGIQCVTVQGNNTNIPIPTSGGNYQLAVQFPDNGGVPGCGPGAATICVGNQRVTGTTNVGAGGNITKNLAVTSASASCPASIGGSGNITGKVRINGVAAPDSAAITMTFASGGCTIDPSPTNPSGGDFQLALVLPLVTSTCGAATVKVNGQNATIALGADFPGTATTNPLTLEIGRAHV